MIILKKKIGIIGGGQLGKMMILEAKRLGFYIAVLDPDPVCAAHSICDEHIVADFYDREAFYKLASMVDIITYELERIDADTLALLEQEGHTIYPSVTALKTIQNKFLQKSLLDSHGIPVPRFAKVSDMDVIRAYGDTNRFGYPLMLKATTGAYDGKGNALIETENGIEASYEKLGGDTRELMVEEFFPFEREFSVVACRGIDGSKVIYPIGDNIHVNNICEYSIVPADISEATTQRAVALAERVMDVFAGVGTFCVEMFLSKEGEVLVNEVAPRPHNSGHYTIEGCFASQYENHIRAIVGLPFGSVALKQPTVMVNLLGENDGPAALLGLEEAYKNPNVRVHLYGKSESKTARKMGHFTVVGDTLEEAVEQAKALKKILRVVGDNT